jgi:hypothetical protein
MSLRYNANKLKKAIWKHLETFVNIFSYGLPILNMYLKMLRIQITN